MDTTVACLLKPVQLTAYEEELIACHRLLSPSMQAAIAMMVSANIKMPDNKTPRERNKIPSLSLVK